MLLTSCRAASRQSGPSAQASVRRMVGTLLMATGSSLLSASAFAQAAAVPSDAAPSERAKRDADKVFHWIMIQGDRTRKAPAAGAKDIKDAKDERPAAKAPRAAPAEPSPVRTKLDATVAAAEAANPMTAAKSAGQPVTTPAAAPPIEAPGATVDASQPDASRSTRQSDPPATAPAVEAADAPQGLIIIAQPAPQFPVNVMRALRRGTVQVQFSVLTDGSVANLEVLKTTNARLNAAALEAIGQWRFQPVSKTQTGAVEVGFNLE